MRHLRRRSRRERKAGLLTGGPELKSLDKEIQILWIGREP